MAVKVAINGFGRIGRNAFKVAVEKYADKMEIVAINDLTDAKTLAHLLEFDSLFGRFNGTVEVKEDALVVNGKEIKIFAERDPANLPWKDLGVEIVIESTGIFNQETAGTHRKRGQEGNHLRSRQERRYTIVGVNEDKYDPANHHIIPTHPAITALHHLQRFLTTSLELRRVL